MAPASRMAAGKAGAQAAMTFRTGPCGPESGQAV